MKYFYAIVSLVISLCCMDAFITDAAAFKTLSQQEEGYSTQCSLEARNSLVSGDLALVERVCTAAIKEIEKSHPDTDVLVDPIMNLASAYALSGQIDKAKPLYIRARNIREKLYGADSRQLKEIDEIIQKQKDMNRQHK